MEVSLTVVNKF